MGADLYGSFYFRDSYNDTSVFWRYGLSWWRDVIPLLSSSGQLRPAAAKTILGLLDRNQVRFELGVAGLSADDRAFYQSKARKLRQLFGSAIRKNEPIVASL